MQYFSLQIFQIGYPKKLDRIWNDILIKVSDIHTYLKFIFKKIKNKAHITAVVGY